MSMTDFDMKQMQKDMGICPTCKDHMPCGCEEVEEFDLEPVNDLLKNSIKKLEALLPEKKNNDYCFDDEAFPFECAVCGLRSNSEEKLSNNGKCFNCDSPL